MTKKKVVVNNCAGLGSRPTQALKDDRFNAIIGNMDAIINRLSDINGIICDKATDISGDVPKSVDDKCITEGDCFLSITMQKQNNVLYICESIISTLERI